MKLALAVLAALLQVSHGLQRGYLYPHGRGVPDKILPPQDDVSSPELFLRTPIVFYNEVYKSVFVNSNGLLSFITELPRFYNLQFPLDYPVIAPFYSNVDVRAAGAVYYRETQDEVVLDRATRTVRAAFSRARDFQAKSVLIVTWLDVGYHNQGGDKVNTYQVVVISDGEDSYVEFLYPDHGLQWIQGSGKLGGLADALAQAGFISGDSRMLTLIGSGTDQVRNLNEWTNVDNPGQWLFHVGQVGSEGNIDQPDTNQEEVEDSSAFCSSGSRFCHSRATCSDFESGFCCVCQDGFFGNGKSCLSAAIPLRVNGKISGNVNGEELSNLDLQAYVVPADGRTYTAISVVPPTVGYDMQSLNVLGSTIGWLFAHPVKGAVNGYQLTGGIANQTVTLRFPQTGQQLTITQHFTGLDVFQQLTMNGHIQGSLPNIPIGSKVIIKDYEEQYTRVGLGQFISQSSQVYQLEGSNVDNQFTVEQLITFDECAGTVPPASTMRLKVVRTYIGYEDKDSIIRFSSTNKITPLDGDEDPCRDGASKCGQYSTCVVEADSYRCVCNPGFQSASGEQDVAPTCEDVDECSTNQNRCNENSVCINTVGSHSCQCNPGYTNEDGNCVKIRTCEDIRCDVNAVCVHRSRGNPQCMCNSGFYGNGTVCISNAPPRQEETPQQPDNEDVLPSEVAPHCVLLGCSCPDGYTINEAETVCTLDRSAGESHDNGRVFIDERACAAQGIPCHPYAACIFFPSSNQYTCECNPGFAGNGQDCVQLEDYAPTPLDDCGSAADCIGEADCVDDHNARRRVCVCHDGFIRDVLTGTCHAAPTDNRGGSCADGIRCHADADCVRDDNDGEYVCRCRSGFEGDGMTCLPEQTGCNVLNDCARTADCLYNEIARGYRCQCKPGYEGDGHECRTLRTCYDDSSLCGEHASCLPSELGGYTCQCNAEYVGDGKLCRPAAARIGNFLLVAQGMAILRVPFQPTSTDRGRPIVMQPYQQAIGIDTDCSENRVYWSDITGGNIYSTDYAGHDIKPFIASDIGSAEGISIDWLSRNIFWTDSSRDTVEVASLTDSTLRKTIVNTSLVNPRGIAVHPSRGKVFWADWDRAAPKIEWANLDGSERSIFLKGPSVKLPNSLVIDFSTDELCWADAGTFRIDCIGIGNRYERTLAAELTYPFGLTISQDHYYYTDWITQKIERITRPGQVKEKPLPPPLGSSGKLYGVVAVLDSCPRLSNICQHENGRCPENYLCLLNGSGGRSCVCASPLCQHLGS